MWQTQDVIIVSDLHLAAERNQGLFRADQELAQFFDWVRTDAGATTVVLAGDVLDFLVAAKPAAPSFDWASAGRRPKYSFNLEAAEHTLSAILECHPEVFDALTHLVQSPQHQLLILSGNHDPELSAPAVQRAIEARLGCSSITPRLNWFVNGEAVRLQIGHIRLLIEHGDLYDAWNRIDHARLALALRYASRGLMQHTQFDPPPGSKLVVDYVAAMRARYPWVDILKPEREAVFPLLVAFSDGWERGNLIKQIKNWGTTLQRRLLSTMARAADDSRIVSSGETSPTIEELFQQWLDDFERATTRGLLADARRELLLSWLQRVAVTNSFFQLDQPDEAAAEVEILLAHDADVVVHGHTHAAKCYSRGQGLYLNSGTWGRLLQLPSVRDDTQWQNFLTGLEEGQHDGELCPTFVRLRQAATGQPVSAALYEWDMHKVAPRLLAAQQHQQAGGQWEVL